jgi:hypothetical protein
MHGYGTSERGRSALFGEKSKSACTLIQVSSSRQTSGILPDAESFHEKAGFPHAVRMRKAGLREVFAETLVRNIEGRALLADWHVGLVPFLLCRAVRVIFESSLISKFHYESVGLTALDF